VARGNTLELLKQSRFLLSIAPFKDESTDHEQRRRGRGESGQKQGFTGDACSSRRQCSTTQPQGDIGRSG
jgi:hypothetical protein